MRPSHVLHVHIHTVCTPNFFYSGVPIKALVDKQFAAAVVLMIFGFAMTQMGQDESGANTFLIGLGVGTIVIAAVWIVVRIIYDIRGNDNRGKKTL